MTLSFFGWGYVAARSSGKLCVKVNSATLPKENTSSEVLYLHPHSIASGGMYTTFPGTFVIVLIIFPCFTSKIRATPRSAILIGNHIRRQKNVTCNQVAMDHGRVTAMQIDKTAIEIAIELLHNQNRNPGLPREKNKNKSPQIKWIMWLLQMLSN